jgi:hypothetical protein
MKYFYLCLSLFLLLSCKKSNDNDIEFISLKVNPHDIGEYYEYLIVVEKQKNNASVIIQSQDYKDSIRRRSFRIDDNSFEYLKKRCYKLQKVDLRKTDSLTSGTKKVTLTFGAKDRKIEYTIWDPWINTQERGLKEFTVISTYMGKISYLGITL